MTASLPSLPTFVELLPLAAGVEHVGIERLNGEYIDLHNYSHLIRVAWIAGAESLNFGFYSEAPRSEFEITFATVSRLEVEWVGNESERDVFHGLAWKMTSGGPLFRIAVSCSTWRFTSTRVQLVA